MKSDNLLIVGAGFTGLIAAHAWPTARIIEAAPDAKCAHKALMRFRSDAVARLTGVEFRKVTVRKAILHEGKFQQPNIALCNLYSQKVVGRLSDRSIWNLDAVERFIAPEDFYEQLIAAVGDRISWATRYEAGIALEGTPIISTIPLSVMAGEHPISTPLDGSNACRRAGVKVTRYRIPNADVFQTVYVPSSNTPVYRMSITSDLLIIEEIVRQGWAEEDADGRLMLAEMAFGIDAKEFEPLDTTFQALGKVDELPAAVRKNALFELTSKYGIYSLGRFACWRNILLDDVVDDIAVIKRLLKTRSAYDAARATV